MCRSAVDISFLLPITVVFASKDSSAVPSYIEVCITVGTGNRIGVDFR
jgi:hypothetical protein